VRAMFWPLFPRSAWAQPATVVAGTTGEGLAVASVRLVGVGLARSELACKSGEGFDLASIRSVGVGTESHCGGGIDSLLKSLYARSVWAQSVTMLAGTSVEGAVVASVRSVGVA
jgi:hypothetical protein